MEKIADSYLKLLIAVKEQIADLVKKGQTNLDFYYADIYSNMANIFPDFETSNAELVAEARLNLVNGNVIEFEASLDKLIKANEVSMEIPKEEKLVLVASDRLPKECQDASEQFIPVVVLSKVGDNYSLVKIQDGLFKDKELVVYNQYLKG